MSDTPRTDAFTPPTPHSEMHRERYRQLLEYARQLERELNEAMQDAQTQAELLWEAEQALKLAQMCRDDTIEDLARAMEPTDCAFRCGVGKEVAALIRQMKVTVTAQGKPATVSANGSVLKCDGDWVKCALSSCREHKACAASAAPAVAATVSYHCGQCGKHVYNFEDVPSVPSASGGWIRNHEWPRYCAEVTGCSAIRWKISDAEGYAWMAISAPDRTVPPSDIPQEPR